LPSIERDLITGSQIRAARALLRWSAEAAAGKMGVSTKTIERLEQHSGVPPSRAVTLREIQRVFETAGVEFIGTPDEGPGVRIWQALTGPRGILKGP